MTANNGRGSDEHKRKSNVVIGNENNGLTRNFASLVGSGHPSTSFCSTTDPKHIVEKLHVRKYHNSFSREVALKKVEEQIPLRLSKRQKGSDSRINLNHEPCKMKSASSTSSYPQKGKGVLQKMSGAECFNDGIVLRVWMKSESCRMKKPERLYIFKQILELVDFAHSQGFVLQEIKPSCFTLSPSNKIKYIGSYSEQVFDDRKSCFTVFKSCLKAIVTCKETESLKQQQHHFKEKMCLDGSSYQHAFAEEKQFVSETIQLEEKWYTSPESVDDGTCTFSSNVYSLGVLLFELLCNIESLEAHSSVMFDMRHRILPPKFLSQNAKEAGFCLWLLHPEPSSRPNTRMILESEFIRELEESSSGDNVIVTEGDVADTEELLNFLISVEEEKKKHETKLTEELNFLNEDIKEVERNHTYETDSVFPLAQLSYRNFQNSSTDIGRSIPRSFPDEARFMSTISQLENSYFSMRFQGLLKEAATVKTSDKTVMESRWRLPHLENVSSNDPKRIQGSIGCLGPFFDGLCKFARYSKFEERGTLRNSDLLSSANVICALSFDRDEDYIAAGGISKKIKIFDLNATSSDSIDIQYPVVEMSNKSKLSCVCWNSYIKNHLASTDYDGVVQMWDAGTGQPLSQYMEHQKRTWSVHFSVSDPKMFASGSDDCSAFSGNAKMQAITRRLGSQSSTSLKSIYPISHHHYGVDHERYVSTIATKGVGHLVRKGTGGRSSVSGIVATVFGATGFLGRYVVQQLAKMGSQVLVPFRGSEDCPRHLKLMGDLGQIVPMKFNPRDESSVKAVMARANVVINLIGRDYETRNYSYEEVHYHMAEKLAKISKEHGGIMRFIQVSCLGASPSSSSRMLRCKAAAEEAVLRELPEATIFKPAAMIGTEDRILNRWAQFAKKYGFLPLMGNANTKIQPVYVVDVASALTTALKDDGTSMGKTYELGGPEIFTIHELAEIMYDVIREWPRYVNVPLPIAKALATPRELLLNKVPFPLPKPETFNLDQIHAFATDNVVSGNALTFNDLGVVPHKLKGYPIEYLIQYRKGGPQFGSTISEKVSPDAWP